MGKILLVNKLLKRKNWQLGWGGCGGEGGAYWGEEGSVFLLQSAEAGGGNNVYGDDIRPFLKVNTEK